MNRVELRAEARRFLGNNIFSNAWLMAVLAIFVVGLIIGASDIVPYIGPFLIAGPMGIGLASAMLMAYRTNTSVDIGKIFSDGFGNFGRNFMIGFMQSLFIFLWSLLLVVPGVIKTYEYCFANFIAVDHPDYDWKQCLAESKRLTDGHKMDLFVLDLSFLGWLILGSLACGVGELWAVAYNFSARMAAYREIVGDASVISAEEF